MTCKGMSEVMKMEILYFDFP